VPEASCSSTPLLHPAGLRAATRASHSLVTALGGGDVHARPRRAQPRCRATSSTPATHLSFVTAPGKTACRSGASVSMVRGPAAPACLGYYVGAEDRKPWTLDRSTAEVFGRNDFNDLAPAPSTHASQVSSSRCSVLPSCSVAERCLRWVGARGGGSKCSAGSETSDFFP
jgi:hypothetical protein